MTRKTRSRGLLAATFVVLGCSRVSSQAVPASAEPAPPPSPPSGAAFDVCPAGCRFKQVQAAIRAAQPGATIAISAGTYSENVLIDKPLVLRGAGPDRTRLESTHGEPAVLARSPSEIAVTLAGLSISARNAGATTGCTSEMGECNKGVVLRGLVRATLDHVRLSESSSGGLWVREFAQATLIDDEISRNQMAGAVASGTALLTLRHSTVADNQGRDVFCAGILVNDEARLVLEDVTVRGNGWSGVWVKDHARAEIRHSDLTDSIGGFRYGSGVLADGQADVRIENSAIENNGTHERCLDHQAGGCHGVLAMGQSRVSIKDSIIRGNANWGVAVGLRQCGYSADYSAAQVVLEGMNVIVGNMKSNLDDGQVCLLAPSPSPSPQPTPSPRPPLLASLRAICVGLVPEFELPARDCRQYSVSIHEDGTVVYAGCIGVKWAMKKWSVGLLKLEQLKNAFKDADFPDHPDFQGGRRPPGSLIIEISYSRSGRSRTVSYRSWSGAPPTKLSALRDRIEEIVGLPECSLPNAERRH